MADVIEVLCEGQPKSAPRQLIRKLFFPKTNRDMWIHDGIPLPINSSPHVFDWFDGFSLLMILANTITLALSKPLEPTGPLADTLNNLDLAFAIYFTVELVIRILAFGFCLYKADKWNVLDTFIVISGIVSSILEFANITPFSLTSLRTVRVLRPLRSLRQFKPGRIIIVSIVSAVQSLGDVALLYLVFVILFGVGGVSQYNSRLRTKCVSADYFNPNITSQYPNFTINDYVRFQAYEQHKFAKLRDFYEEVYLNWTCSQLHRRKYETLTMTPSLTQTTHTQTISHSHTRTWHRPKPRKRRFPGTPFPAMCDDFVLDRNFSYIKPDYMMEKQYAATELPSPEAIATWAEQRCDPTSALYLRGYICPFGYVCTRIENPDYGIIGFDNIAQALLTLFTSITMTLWYDVMYMAMDAVDPSAAAYMVIVVVVGTYFIINLSTVLMSVAFQRATIEENAKNDPQDDGPPGPFTLAFRFLKEKLSTLFASKKDKAGAEMVPPSTFQSVRMTTYKAITSRYGAGFFYGVIIANVAMMMADHYGMPRSMETAFENGNFVFTIIYTVELGLRLFSTPVAKYWKTKMNYLDITIVVCSWVDYADPDWTFSAVASFRCLRLLSILKAFPIMYVWLKVIAHSLVSSSILALLIAFCIFIFAALGMHLFGGYFCDLGGDFITNPVPGCVNRPRQNYDGIVEAMITSFIVMTGDDWEKVMFNGMRSRGDLFALYFVCFYIISNYILLNVLIGILLSVRPNNEEEQEEDDDNDDEENRKKGKRLVDQIEVRKTDDKKLPDIILPNGTVIPAIQPHEDPAVLEDLDPTERNLAERLLAKTEEKLKNTEDLITGTLKEGGKLLMGAVIQDDVDGDGPKYTNLQLKIQAILEDGITQTIIIVIIFGSSLNLALESPVRAPDTTSENIIRILDFGMNIIFTLEVLVSFAAYGVIMKPWCYLRRDTWNVVDFALAVSAIAGEALTRMKKGDNTAAPLRGIRVIRAIRPLRFVKRAEGLKLVVSTLIKSIAPLRNLLLVILVILTLWGIMGVQLFKGAFHSCTEDPTLDKEACKALGYRWQNADLHFDHLGAAYMSLFAVATMEGWSQVMFNGMDAVGPGKAPQVNYLKRNSLYFISWVIIGGVFFVNLFVSIIIDSYQQEKKVSKNKASMRFLTPAQNAWVKSHHILLQQVPLLDYDEQRRATAAGRLFVVVRREIRKIVRHQLFDVFIYCCIVVNFLIMLVDQYPKPQVMSFFISGSNIVFAFIFSAEVIMKLVAEGPKTYLAGRWNRFDVIIVALSVSSVLLELAFASATFVAVFRTMRVARLLRIIRKSRRLQTVLKRFLFALISLNNVAAIVLLLIFVYGVLGMKLFGRVESGLALSIHANFNDIGNAILTMIRVTTGGNWVDLYVECRQSAPDCNEQFDGCGLPVAAELYYVSFLLLGMFILVNLFVAVIMDSFSVSAEQAVEYIADSDGAQFLKLWLHFDPERTYRMEAKYLITLIRALPPDNKLGMGQVPERQRLRRELVFLDGLQLVEYGGLIELQDLVAALCERAYGKGFALEGKKRRKPEVLPPKRQLALNKKSDMRFRRDERDRYKPEDLLEVQTSRRFAAMIFEAYWQRRAAHLVDRARFALIRQRNVERVRRRGIGAVVGVKRTNHETGSENRNVLSERASSNGGTEADNASIALAPKNMTDEEQFYALIQLTRDMNRRGGELRDVDSTIAEQQSIFGDKSGSGGILKLPELESVGSSDDEPSGQTRPPPAATAAKQPPWDEFADLL